MHLINIGFQRKLLERMNMPKTIHRHTLERSKFFAVSKQNPIVYSAARGRAEIRQV